MGEAEAVRRSDDRAPFIVGAKTGSEDSLWDRSRRLQFKQKRTFAPSLCSGASLWFCCFHV